MNSKITTFLMFQGDAEEAIDFYVTLFDDSEIVTRTEFESAVHFQFTLNGQRYLALDSSTEHDFTFTPSFSLFVECDSEEELNRLYEQLSKDGELLMPLDNYGFSQKYAWVNDRFGVSWQLNLQ